MGSESVSYYTAGGLLFGRAVPDSALMNLARAGKSGPDKMDWVRQQDPQPREFWHPEVRELPRILWADDPFGLRRGAGPRPDFSWLED